MEIFKHAEMLLRIENAFSSKSFLSITQTQNVLWKLIASPWVQTLAQGLVIFIRRRSFLVSRWYLLSDSASVYLVWVSKLNEHSWSPSKPLYIAFIYTKIAVFEIKFVYLPACDVFVLFVIKHNTQICVFIFLLSNAPSENLLAKQTKPLSSSSASYYPHANQKKLQKNHSGTFFISLCVSASLASLSSAI